MDRRDADRLAKRERVDALRGTRPLLLSSHEAVAWYLDGIRSHVSLAGPPVVAVRIDDAGDTLFVAANESERLVAEELAPADRQRVIAVPWQMPPITAAREAGPALEESDVAAQLRAARASLLPAERDRYRALGREVAVVLTDTADALRPATTERAAAAEIARRLVERSIDPLVILVAGAGRLGHRHPLPTAAPLGARAMLVVCGRRHGLIANATRWVGEAGVDDERILDVEADFFAATRPGASVGSAFAAGIEGYGAAGFGSGEWRRHHQGGPTGYAGRDPRATHDITDRVQDGHAFAWNPSAPGAKVEDTVLISATGVDVLTWDARWPSVVHGGVARPLARPF